MGYVGDAVLSHPEIAAVVFVELAAMQVAGVVEVADMEGSAEAAWDLGSDNAAVVLEIVALAEEEHDSAFVAASAVAPEAGSVAFAAEEGPGAAPAAMSAVAGPT